MNQVEKKNGGPVIYGLVGRMRNRLKVLAVPSEPPCGIGAGVSDLAAAARQDLLAAICDFLTTNNLPVTPENLGVACEAFSGSAPRLEQKIAARAAEGHLITEKWLRTQHPARRRQGEQDVSRQLAEELDRSLKLFARSSGSARDATNRFSMELDRQVAELGEDAAVPAHRDLLAVAQQMAERARQAEAQLRESEQEAKMLRRRLGRARREAERDHLTGLPNRRAFEVEFQRQYAEAKAANEALSVAFCDVDNFKIVNDRHGHDTGDRILKVIAGCLASIADDKCHVARHGGEEFVLLFRGCTLEEAAEKLNAAREGLAARKLVNRHTDEPIGCVSFSAGLADVWSHSSGPDALRAADEALLEAKRLGRNRVVIAGVVPA